MASPQPEVAYERSFGELSRAGDPTRSDPSRSDPSRSDVAPQPPERRLVHALRRVGPGSERAVRDSLHLDAVAFCRGHLRPMRTVHGADAVATFLSDLGCVVDTWMICRTFRDDSATLRAVAGDRLVATIEVRFEGDRAAGLLVYMG